MEGMVGGGGQALVAKKGQIGSKYQRRKDQKNMNNRTPNNRGGKLELEKKLNYLRTPFEGEETNRYKH